MVLRVGLVFAFVEVGNCVRVWAVPMVLVLLVVVVAETAGLADGTDMLWSFARLVRNLVDCTSV